jgi:SAM-dependent methyltransferase
MALLHRLLHRYDNDGARSLLLGFYRSLRAKFRHQPAPTERPGGAPDFAHPFDIANAADTSGFIPGEKLATAPLTLTNPDLYTTAYYAISPSSLMQAIERLPGAPETLGEFTFVDLGCGKGRALLVAAQYPFHSIVGVELYEDLCRVAKTNTAARPQISIVQDDAATVVYPQTPLVVYLYHPFLAPVLRKVLKNLEQQYMQAPRQIYLLYANPSYPRVMARFRFLKQVWDYAFPLSAEDAAADRHGITAEHFTLYGTNA